MTMFILSIEDDYVHMIILLTPRDLISYAMQIIKEKTSTWMKKKIRRKHGLYERQSLWTRGRFASTIDMNENIIKCYLKHQKHHNEVKQPSLSEKLIN